MPIELPAFLTSYAFRKVADACFKGLTRAILARRKYQLSTNFAEAFAQRLSQIANEVFTWSHQLEFIQPQAAKVLAKLYIDLDLFVEPLADLPEGRNKKQKIKTILKESHDHIVILGKPGAGKTTTVKAIANTILLGELSDQVKGFFPIPLVIRLREKVDQLSIYRYIFDVLGIDVLTNSGDLVEIGKLDTHVLKEFVHGALNEVPLVVLIDGFDELRSLRDGNKVTAKEQFIYDFEQLCMNVKRSLLVLTSRQRNLRSCQFGVD